MKENIINFIVIFILAVMLALMIKWLASTKKPVAPETPEKIEKNVDWSDYKCPDGIECKPA